MVKHLIDNTLNSPKMGRVKIMPRIIAARLRQALEHQKSVLLLGPRQPSKTTLLEMLQPNLLLNFLRPEIRQHTVGSEFSRCIEILASPNNLLHSITHFIRRITSWLQHSTTSRSRKLTAAMPP